MKTILAPTDNSAYMTAALETARLVANRFGATVEGIAVRPAFAEVVAPDPIVAVTIPPADWDEGQFLRHARQTFEAAAARPLSNGAAFRWRGGSAVEDNALGSLGRLYDITVVSRPGGKGSRMAAFEAALFDSGRPVLMSPPDAPKSVGEAILIHWNCSSETARAIALGLPFLKLAKKVMLLTVEGSVVPGPSARDSLGYLAAHGIAATEKTVASRGKGPGDTILAEAAAMGADMLLKGAYTQSRLRQMIFGGATSHILAKAELPVMFAH
jgi:nucleotide-binding universal stress UspA family protein